MRADLGAGTLSSEGLRELGLTDQVRQSGNHAQSVLGSARGQRSTAAGPTTHPRVAAALTSERE